MLKPCSKDMKYPLLRLLVMSTKFFAYIIIIQVFFANLALAHNSSGQSLSNVEIKTEIGKASLSEPQLILSEILKQCEKVANVNCYELSLEFY